MDALQTAQARLTEAEVFYDISERKDGNAHYRSLSERCYREALAFAAVAQAEQLKRIADALHSIDRTLDRIFNEGIGVSKND